MRQTPLHSVHVAAGARMVPFAGFDMPVSYTDITTEHHAVRRKAGLFDLSHMGRVRFRGPDADRLAQRVMSFDAAKLAVGRTRYALLCLESGGILDDILVSREDDALLLVINAGNRDADLEFFRSSAEGLDVEIADDSEDQAMLAVQGPEAEGILVAMGWPEAKALKYYKHMTVDGPFGTMILSRTGYTGEDGFEVLIDAAAAASFWAKALEVGSPVGLIPCGLGARDTLRLEAGMPLHGNEIGPEVNAYEGGLDFAVRSEHPFRGSEALAQVKADGPARRLIGLEVDGPRIPRGGGEVLLGGEVVGVVCSGTRSPTLDKNIATALVSTEAAASGGPFQVRIRRHEAPASVVEMPFYRRSKES